MTAISEFCVTMISCASRRSTGFLPVEQLGLGHVDRALVMGNHHRGEVVVGSAVHRRATHAHLHGVHRVIHQGGEGLFARRPHRSRLDARNTVLVSLLSHVRREGGCREEQSRAYQEKVAADARAMGLHLDVSYVTASARRARVHIISRNHATPAPDGGSVGYRTCGIPPSEPTTWTERTARLSGFARRRSLRNVGMSALTRIGGRRRRTASGRKLPVRQSWQYDPTKGGLSSSKGVLVNCVAACLVLRTSRYRPRRQ
jgi:hypothetical protein